jgi:U3 small nucleolar RNA-associated protein 21
VQTYDLTRGLSLVFLSRPQTFEEITSTCAYRDRVFVAWGGQQPDSRRGLWAFRRGKLVGELHIPNTVTQELTQIVVFGSWIVASGLRAIEVWKTDGYEHYTTITPSRHGAQSLDRVLSGRICTMPTFLNKIFVGRLDGNVEVYNVSTGKLVHTILAPSSESGSVTALQPTLALCTLAIAYADGSILIHDVEADEPVLQLRQSRNAPPITSISFRSDGRGAGDDGSKDGVMATASNGSGDITFWDLTRGGRVAGVLRTAHETSSSSRSSGINRIEFLPGQPVIISTGMDNALRSWIFDETPFSAIPRLLHSRSGHAAPVMTLAFLPAASDGSEAAGKWLLSAGQDRALWGFSMRKDGQSSELSQGHVKKKAKKMGHLQDSSTSVEELKAPPITSIACSLNRDGGMGGVGGPVWMNSKNASAEEANMTGWESVVTAHEGDKLARTWFWGRKKAGRWTFESSDHTPVSSVAITTCGTFALIGSTGGTIDMFNLQSGIHRQRFPPKPTLGEAKKLKQQQSLSREIIKTSPHHTDRVTGITVDNVNKTVVSCGLDGSIIFWDFMSGKCVDIIHLESAAATALRYNATSGLMSFACDDLCIRIIDIETRRTVRELWGCVGQIYDHNFSHDGRWIVACSMDSVIRVFDLATSHLIDAFRTPTCTSVAFSSTGEFLATAHTGSLGINIWNNKSLYTRIPTRQINEETGIIDLTGTTVFSGSSQLALHDGPVDDDEDFPPLPNSTLDIDQLHSSLLTLSILPQSRWQTLLNLDTIRQRNKPIEPPQQPRKAPFFLPSTLTNGLKPSDPASNTLPAEASSLTPAERSRISRIAAQPQHVSPFSTLLSAFAIDPDQDPTNFVSHLEALPPSAADLEIRTLQHNEMLPFVRALTRQLTLNKGFELVNTWMSCFLRMHGDVVQASEELQTAVVEWKRAAKGLEQHLEDLNGYCKGVIEFLRSAR